MTFQDRLIARLRQDRIPFTVRYRTDEAASRFPGSDWDHPDAPLVHTALAFIGKRLTMLVTREEQKVDLIRLKSALSEPSISIVDAERLKAALPDIDVNCIPPLGNLWKIPVIVDSNLEQVDWIQFYAGDCEEIVTLPMRDFERLVTPRIVSFAASIAPSPIIPG